MRKKIIVIGAGIAGLAVANRLIEFEYDVLILEARNRCGGRICPDHSMSVTLGKGAMWLHGLETNPLVEKVKRSNSITFSLDKTKFLSFDQNRCLIPENKISGFNQEFILRYEPQNHK